MHVDTIDDFVGKQNFQNRYSQNRYRGLRFERPKGAQQMLSRGQISFIYTEFNDCVARRGITGGALNEISDYLAQFKFHFVATYTDYVHPIEDLFVVSNLLMVRGA